MSKKVLLISDYVGVGKVALSALMPVVTHYGYEIYNLPTSIISNTVYYGKFERMDTTEYMVNTIRVQKELGFTFDAILIGYVANEEQLRIIIEYCKDTKARILCSTVMGKKGRLFNGISRETISIMTKLSSFCELSMPNYTEACYMTYTPYKESITLDEARDILNNLRQLGCRSIVMTSVPLDGKMANVIYDGDLHKIDVVPYQEVQVHVPGIGDIFSGVCLSHLLMDQTIFESIKIANDVTYSLLKANENNEDLNLGIPIESYLHLLK